MRWKKANRTSRHDRAKRRFISLWSVVKRRFRREKQLEVLEGETCESEWVESFIVSKQGRRWLRRSLKESMEEYDSGSEEDFFLEIAFDWDLPYGIENGEEVEQVRQRWLRDTACRRYWELVAQQDELILEKCFSHVDLEELGIPTVTAVMIALPLYQYGGLSPQETAGKVMAMLRTRPSYLEDEVDVVEFRRCFRDWLQSNLPVEKTVEFWDAGYMYDVEQIRDWLQEGFTAEEIMEFWKAGLQYDIEQAKEIKKIYGGQGYTIEEMIDSRKLTYGFSGRSTGPESD